jgi:N-acetylneuraminate synthase/N,N'-diacetyllegionaminate synthase
VIERRQRSDPRRRRDRIEPRRRPRAGARADRRGRGGGRRRGAVPLVPRGAAGRAAAGDRAAADAQAHRARVELRTEWHARLRERASARGLVFLATPFDEERATLLAALGVPAFPVAAGDLDGRRCCARSAASAGRCCSASRGAGRGAIDAALGAIGEGAGAPPRRPPVVLVTGPNGGDGAALHGVGRLDERYACLVGWSDRQPTPVLALGAVARGACLVVKPFTDDRARRGPEHASALDPARSPRWSPRSASSSRRSASRARGAGRCRRDVPRSNASAACDSVRPWGGRAVAVAIVANLVGGTVVRRHEARAVGAQRNDGGRRADARRAGRARAARGLPHRRPVARGRLRSAAPLAMGVLGYALPLVLGSYGLRRSTATNAALLIGTEPLCVVVLGVLLLGERLGRPRIIALGLGLAGATIIVCNGIPFVNVTYAPHLVGDLLLVAHGAAWGIYTIAAKRLLDRHDPLAVSAASLAVALPCLLPLAVWRRARSRGTAPRSAPRSAPPCSWASSSRPA